MKTMMRMLAIATAVAGGSAAYADEGMQQHQQQGQTQDERALQNVYFGFDSDTPIGDLLMVANLLECNPDHTIVLDGYADSVGSEAYNADLSQRRAEAVRDQLVEYGIDRDRILLGVFGEAGKEMDSNALERRVEIRTSGQPVAALIESRRANAVAIVSPDGQVQEGENQPAPEPERTAGPAQPQQQDDMPEPQAEEPIQQGEECPPCPQVEDQGTMPEPQTEEPIPQEEPQPLPEEGTQDQPQPDTDVDVDVDTNTTPDQQD